MGKKCDLRRGDVNASGNVGGDDVVYLASHVAGIEEVNLPKIINILYVSHGLDNDPFWNEIDEGIQRLATTLEFDYTHKRTNGDISEMVNYINELKSGDMQEGSEMMKYDGFAFTILSSEIADALSDWPKHKPFVTFNTSVASVPNALCYCGIGSDGEIETGLNLAINVALSIMNVEDLQNNNFNFDIVKNTVTKFNELKSFVESTKVGIIALFNEPNDAYEKRMLGIARMGFPIVECKTQEDMLKVLNDNENDTSENKKDAFYISALSSSMLPIAINFNENSGTIGVAVCDETSYTINLLNEGKINIISGSPPVCQASNVLQELLLNLLAFNCDYDLQSNYMSMGNKQRKTGTNAGQRRVTELYDAKMPKWAFDSVLQGEAYALSLEEESNAGNEEWQKEPKAGNKEWELVVERNEFVYYDKETRERSPWNMRFHSALGVHYFQNSETREIIIDNPHIIHPLNNS